MRKRVGNERSVGRDPQRAKALSEWRAAEAKNKSKCYANAKDNERVQDAVLDCKLGRGRDGRGSMRALSAKLIQIVIFRNFEVQFR